MKKNFMKIALGLFVLVAFSACKKDYTCTCVTTVADISTSSAITINDKKSDAEDACDALDASTSLGGIESSTACSID
jgi:hypothetical protein|tara:strand:- start:963 stop:1193 length:231 start_codon:yes stop_codon:yes gene_type:complete